jgi:hypothetical protein
MHVREKAGGIALTIVIEVPLRFRAFPRKVQGKFAK